MSDNLNFKQYRQKAFLYNFFIVWNLFVIILLILLHLYFNTIRVSIKKPVTIPKAVKPGAELKLFWESKKQFQKLDPSLFSFHSLSANNDSVDDIVTISRKGNIFILDGSSGNLLSQVSIRTTSADISIEQNMIYAGNSQGEFFIINSLGKIISTTNFKKGKIVDIKNNCISLNKSLILISRDHKVKTVFTNFKSTLIGPITAGCLNSDSEPDYIVADKKSLHCFDGLYLKELWEHPVPYIYSGKTRILENKKKDRYIILPLYNGMIWVLTRGGGDMIRIRLSGNLVSAPLVCGPDIFIQASANNQIYAFDLSRRKNIWSYQCDEKIIDIKNTDINFDDQDEILALTGNNKLFLINSRNGIIIDSTQVCDPAKERIISPLFIADLDKDSNYELVFSTDQGNVYAYKYIVLNKKFNLKKLLKYFKK